MTADVVQRRVTMQYLINPDVTLCQRERIERGPGVVEGEVLEGSSGVLNNLFQKATVTFGQKAHGFPFEQGRVKRPMRDDTAVCPWAQGNDNIEV